MQAVPRPGLNTFYVGFNNTFAPFDNPKVRQAIAMGIDRERHRADVLPAGLGGRLALLARAPSRSAAPATRGTSSIRRRPGELLAAAGFPDGFETTIQYRDVARPYLPDPTGVATELQAQLLANLDIRAELEVLPEDDVPRHGRQRRRRRHPPPRTRRVSIPEVSSLLDPHFGAGASREFGAPIDAIVDALTAGAATIDEAARTTAYTEANTAIRSQRPDDPDRPRRLADRRTGPTSTAPSRRRSATSGSRR